MLRRPSSPAASIMGRATVLALVLSVVAALSACSTTRPGAAAPTSAGSGVVEVVAAENFWGSIAAQIGGDRVHVVSIIDNPDADPHDYEPTAADARTIDAARVVIGNGIGYDPWFGHLVSSSATSPLRVDVGTITGLGTGDNPHQWYSPVTVQKVIDAITAAFVEAAPDRAAEFRAGRTRFDDVTLAHYHALVSAIHRDYAGVAVGASESIFAPLASALGLDLITPAGFLSALSEGTDPSAADKATTDRQIERHQIKVWVYNSQNATPDVARLNAAARAAGIPIVTVTETMSPAGSTFQDWQAGQLTRLQAALAESAR